MNRAFHALRRLNWDGIGFFIAVIILWEIAAILADSFVFPRATVVADMLWDDRATLAAQAVATLRRALVGFVIALVIALPVGLFIGRIPLLADLIEPLTEFLRPLPPIAVIPLAMMLLGIGDPAKLVVVVYGAAFPILVNTIDAVRVQDPIQSRVARSLRLTAFERMVLMDLPAATPRILSGVRLAITVALLLAVVSEMLLSTDGLGDYLRQAQSTFSMARVLAGIIIIAILSLAVSAIANRLTRPFVDWHIKRSAGDGA